MPNGFEYSEAKMGFVLGIFAQNGAGLNVRYDNGCCATERVRSGGPAQVRTLSACGL
jgi:hypothetical protein